MTNKLGDALSGGERIADDDIYLDPARATEPKELFKQLGQVIADAPSAPKSVLDIGCATGELLAHLQNILSDTRLTGVDVSEPMLQEARKRLPDIQFENVSALDEDWFARNSFDVVICCGVLGIFDHPEAVIRNMAAATNAGGTFYLIAAFNNQPVDLLTRYRRADVPDAPLELGWNVFSKYTIEQTCQTVDSNIVTTWQDFKMPFAIAPTDDPMRTWTIAAADNPHQLVNGVGQLINLSILKAQMPSPENC